MRKIELKVVALNLFGMDVKQVENILDMRECVYNLLFVERWCKFLKGFETMEVGGLTPEIESGVTNSPHDYDAEDYYLEAFRDHELEYIQDRFMPRGDEDFGCGKVIKVSVLDNGEEKVLYE